LQWSGDNALLVTYSRSNHQSIIMPERFDYFQSDKASNADSSERDAQKYGSCDNNCITAFHTP